MRSYAHIGVAALANASQMCLASGRILSRGKPKPSTQIVCRLELARKADVFQKLFDAVSMQPDMEYAMVDATIVRVHRHGQGAKGGLRARS